MRIYGKRFSKWVAVFIILAILLPTFIVTTGVIPKTDVKAAGSLNKEDNKIAEDISNMTGVKTEEIVKLRNKGNTWNEILDKLKKTSTDSSDKEVRNAALAKSGLDESYIEKLKAEGFKDEEITEAKMLVERVKYELGEIVSAQDEPVLDKAPAAIEPDKKDEDDTEKYGELSEKINGQTAVYLMLKLKKDFMSMENVLDEYLLSLQIGIDMEKYIADKKAYEKDKKEKSVGVDRDKVITLAKIEEKMLKKIQEGNAGSKDKSKAEAGTANEKTVSRTEDAMPKSPLPEVEDTKPKNPADDVMREVNDIKNRSLGVDIEKEGR